MNQHELAAHKPYKRPLDIADVERIAGLAVKSGLISLKTPEAAFFVIMTGLELGLSPMTALRSVHVVDGKPVLSAALMVALAKRHPDCLYFMLVDSSPDGATYETKRRGDPAPTRKSWLWADAKQAGLSEKMNWKKHPTAMLEARCSAALARAVYPDLLLGVYEESEGEEIAASAQRPRPEVVTASSGYAAIVGEVLPALPISLNQGTALITAAYDHLDTLTTRKEIRAWMETIKADPLLVEVYKAAGRKHNAAPKAAPPAPPREMGEDDVNAEGPTPKGVAF